MNTNKIEALVERVEKATEGSRELDGAICALLEGDEEWIIGHEPGRFPQEPIYGTKREAFEAILPHGDGADYINAPDYTTSINAALALVERELPGWAWAFAKCHKDFLGVGEAPISVDLFGPPQWSEEDEYGHQQYWCDSASASGATLPLAIIAALLRAMKDQSDD